MRGNKEGTFHEPRLSWTSDQPDARRTHYMGVDGRISLARLLEHMATIAPDLRPEDMELNWATVAWESDPTPEERAEREARKAERQAKTEEWERRTYERLRAKYGEASA